MRRVTEPRWLSAMVPRSSAIGLEGSIVEASTAYSGTGRTSSCQCRSQWWWRACRRQSKAWRPSYIHWSATMPCCMKSPPLCRIQLAPGNASMQTPSTCPARSIPLCLCHHCTPSSSPSRTSAMTWGTPPSFRRLTPSRRTCYGTVGHGRRKYSSPLARLRYLPSKRVTWRYLTVDSCMRVGPTHPITGGCCSTSLQVQDSGGRSRMGSMAPILCAKLISGIISCATSASKVSTSLHS
mmetsp:Transcript_13850/g.29555  ORF Transcript_13850/g.29555 Transcript_13850/m.29555 type:complete len:238 (-) Transcript_13850:348-1061(-)